MITEENKESPVKQSASGFNVVDSVSDPLAASSKKEYNEHFMVDSVSSIQQAKAEKRGKTREEALLGIKVKQATLMDTGEILLGNGKM